MLLEVEVAFVVEHAVEHEQCVAVGAFDRTAVERGIVVGDEGVELQREVVKAGAVGPLQDLPGHGEALAVAGGRAAVAPTCGGVEARDAVDDAGERGALVLLDEPPVADMPELAVWDAGGELSHGVQAQVAAVGKDGGEQRAHFAGVGLLLALPEKVGAEPQVVLHLDEQVRQADRTAACIEPAVQLSKVRQLFGIERLGAVGLQPPSVVVEADLPVAGHILEEPVEGGRQASPELLRRGARFGRESGSRPEGLAGALSLRLRQEE